jgi:hypothetical protein
MRFDFYGQKDSRDVAGTDMLFQGIDMTRDRPLLAQGMLSRGENTRTRTGHVIQRRGTIMSPDFNPASGVGAPLVGSEIIRNPNNEEVLIVAPRNVTYTWVLGDGKDPYKVNYAAGATGSNGISRVQLVQAFEKVLLLRSPLQGTPNQNLVWDGDPTQTVPGVADSKWEVTTLSTEGLTLVPGMHYGEPFMDRIVYYWGRDIPSKRDTWLLSDVLDYTSYDPVFQSIRTNSGEADFITRIMAYFKSSVVIFKDQSIHMATVLPTYPVSVSQRILNSTVGSIGNRMPLMVGGDIIFLSKPNGFYRLSEVIQDQITALPSPISEPIQRVIDDIRWDFTSDWGCSAALDNYAFFGVSLGQHSGQNSNGRLNAILVYDTQRKVWESAGDIWRDSDFSFSALHITNYGRIHRLFAIDYLTGVTYLLYEGINDETLNGSLSVPFKMETRGFFGDDLVSVKRFGRASIGIQTVDPEITVTAINDGFNEEKVLTPVPITKDRTKFYTHGHKAFNVDTDDDREPKREDYSVATDDNFVGEDYETIAVGPVAKIPATIAMSVGEQQESLERFLVRSYGAWCALRIENDQGTCEVSSVTVESTHAMNTVRTAA